MKPIISTPLPDVIIDSNGVNNHDTIHVHRTYIYFTAQYVIFHRTNAHACDNHCTILPLQQQFILILGSGLIPRFDPMFQNNHPDTNPVNHTYVIRLLVYFRITYQASPITHSIDVIVKWLVFRLSTKKGRLAV